MLLNQLNNNEKNAFLSLCVHAAKANNVFADEEYAMLYEYCREMGVEMFDVNSADDFELVTNVFKSSTIKNKKIVLFEILGLLYSDGLYDDLEKDFIKNFIISVGDLSQADVETFSEYITDYLVLFNKIVSSIDS